MCTNICLFACFQSMALFWAIWFWSLVECKPMHIDLVYIYPIPGDGNSNHSTMTNSIETILLSKYCYESNHLAILNRKLDICVVDLLLSWIVIPAIDRIQIQQQNLLISNNFFLPLLTIDNYHNWSLSCSPVLLSHDDRLMKWVLRDEHDSHSSCSLKKKNEFFRSIIGI